MTKTILGVFDDRQNAEDAILDLENAGYDVRDISIVMKDYHDTKDMERPTGSNVATGAVSGATTGAALGGIAGLLIGVGAIAIPGIGGLLIGGPLAAMLGLAGAAATTVSGAATGALAGGIVGALTNLGVPEEEAQEYANRIREGAVLLAVPAVGQEIGEVSDILKEQGATNIRSIAVPYERFEHRTHQTDELIDDDEYAQRPYSDYSSMAGIKGGKTQEDRQRIGETKKRVRSKQQNYR